MRCISLLHDCVTHHQQQQMLDTEAHDTAMIIVLLLYSSYFAQDIDFCKFCMSRQHDGAGYVHVSVAPPAIVAVLAQVPVAVPEEAQAVVSQATGGFVSLTILPRHVKDSSLDDMVWSLLTFHDYVQYHVKCFKVIRHVSVAKSCLIMHNESACN